MVPVTRKRVTVFRRKLADGTESLFINYRIDGKRIREPLNLYLNPGTSARIKIENSNTLAMAEVAVKNGAELFLNTRVTAIEKGEHFTIHSSKGEKFEARYVINAAGVASLRAGRMFYISADTGKEGLADEGVYDTRLFRPDSLSGIDFSMSKADMLRSGEMTSAKLTVNLLEYPMREVNYL